MNTTELKKLAEAATPGPWVHATDIGQIGSIETLHGTVVAQSQSLICDDVRKQRDNNSKYIAAANPAAILKLLAINAELVEALKDFGVHTRDCGVNNYRFNSPCICGLDSAVAKAEGGEL